MKRRVLALTLAILAFSLIGVFAYLKSGEGMGIVLWIILCAFISIPLIAYATIQIIFSGVYRDRKHLPSMNHSDSPSVIVIIPTRNDPSIFDALPDVLMMDYTNFKVCVVDDSDNINFLENLKKLESDRVSVLHREKRVGRKGGAINYGLDWLRQSSREPEFVAIFDADHHPTPDFLTKAVSIAVETGKPIIVGWQPHEIADNDIFGKLIRVSWRATAIDFDSQTKLGFAPIFGGSAGLFDYGWLSKVRFNEKAFSEDWDISIRAYLREGNHPIIFRDDLRAVGVVPEGLKEYIPQQIRWAEGAIAALRQNFWAIITSPKLSIRTKIGLFYDGLQWAQSLLIVISLLLIWGWFTSGSLVPLGVSIGLIVYYEVGWVSRLLLATQIERFTLRSTVSVFLFAHLMLYAMLPVYFYATLRGWLLDIGPWHVTKKRKEEKLQAKELSL